MAFTAVAAPAFAYCTVLPGADIAEAVANQTALTLCRAAELHDRTAQQAQELQFQADLQAATKTLELDLKMQQTFAAAGAVATLPAF